MKRTDPRLELADDRVARGGRRSRRSLVIASLLVLLLGGLGPSRSTVAMARQTTGDGHDSHRWDGDQKAAEETVEAVDRALAWLAKNQNRDGSWTGSVGLKLNTEYEVEHPDQPHVGVTALAGMAFLAGGHLPDRGRYGKTISKATDFILSCVDANSGYIEANGTRMYSHAFATLYLAEVVGMTKRADLRESLQRAVDFIVNSQNELGSWRYLPFAVESDMSITVCQLMGLRAARNIGIKVPKSTIDRAVRYVRESYISETDRRGYLFNDGYYFLRRGGFKYQKHESSTTRSSFALTAAGIASMYNAGVYTDDKLAYSLETLKDSYKLVQDRSDHFFYWYGHYYAVQAMYVAGDPWWSWYYKQIRRDLLDSQKRDGFWVNRVGPGDAFSTAVASIILQVPYEYLPIMQR